MQKENKNSSKISSERTRRKQNKIFKTKSVTAEKRRAQREDKNSSKIS